MNGSQEFLTEHASFWRKKFFFIFFRLFQYHFEFKVLYHVTPSSFHSIGVVALLVICLMLLFINNVVLSSQWISSNIFLLNSPEKYLEGTVQQIGECAGYYNMSF